MNHLFCNLNDIKKFFFVFLLFFLRVFNTKCLKLLFKIFNKLKNLMLIIE